MGYQSYPPAKRRPLRPTDLFNAGSAALNSPVGRALLNAGSRRIQNALNSYSPLSTMTGTTTSMAGMEDRKRMFRPSSDAMQLMKRKMNTRLNKDRNVAMSELYNALYPRRSVVVESSYQMYTGAAQKMTCMNVFRHQDLGVLDPFSSTFKVQSTADGDSWPDLIPPCPDTVDPISFPPDNDGTDVCNVKYNRTCSGYTMRGYGLNVQNENNVAGYPSMQVQGQMYIGPGNHCVWDPAVPGVTNPPDIGMPAGNDVYGVKDNVDPASFLGVFTNWANDVPVVNYPNLDRRSVSVGDIMGCCQTLWSPICAQSIEAASANLGYNTLGIGTVDSRTASLGPDGVGKDQSGLDFGPKTPERLTGLAKLVPRNELDPVGTSFTWTKHSADYKITNTYSYPVEVEFIVYKVGGLTSRDQVSTTGSPERLVTEYYPGVNGPLPYTASNGGIFDVFFGGSGPGVGGMVNRSMILDFMSAWQNKIRPADTPVQGVQLPTASRLAITDPLYGGPQGLASAPNFQIATKTHWPLTNARWKSFMSPRGCKSPFEFMREFSRKTIKLQSGELASHRLDLGGFKYSLEDIGYYSQKGSGSQTFKAFPVYSQNRDKAVSQIQYANRGLMNGSVVVAVVLKGTTVAANAPIPRTGPNPMFPRTKYDGSSIANAVDAPNGQQTEFQQRQSLVVDRGEDLTPPGTTVRGNFASGSVNAAASLLVECKESVEFQPMMNKRPRLLRNSQTHTNKSLLLTASCPVAETVRTIPEPSTDTFTKANTNNNFSKTRTDA